MTMVVRKTFEVQLNSPEQIEEALQQAIDLMERYNLSLTENDATLAQLVNLHNARQVGFEQVGLNGLGIVG